MFSHWTKNIQRKEMKKCNDAVCPLAEQNSCSAHIRVSPPETRPPAPADARWLNSFPIAKPAPPIEMRADLAISLLHNPPAYQWRLQTLHLIFSQSLPLERPLPCGMLTASHHTKSTRKRRKTRKTHKNWIHNVRAQRAQLWTLPLQSVRAREAVRICQDPS